MGFINQHTSLGAPHCINGGLTEQSSGGFFRQAMRIIFAKGDLNKLSVQMIIFTNLNLAAIWG